MENCLERFCTCGEADYAFLKGQIDRCAGLGRSYEFPSCRLPAGCTPQTATIGFWHDRQGYAVYTIPPVSGRPTGPASSAFFSGVQRFYSFEALALFLQALGRDLEETPAEDSPFFSLYRDLLHTLRQRVAGQDRALETVAFKLCGHMQKREPVRPLSLIFYGPTGVGKSELGKAVAPALNHCGGASYQFIWTELNTFTQPHSVYRLTGAPPGYAGYDDPPVFEAVVRNPKTVFMFDELDKAHPDVLKVFLSILDEGRCAARRLLENETRELDFRSCVFLFTTNADLSAQAGQPVGFRPDRLEPIPPAMPLPGGETSDLAWQIFCESEQARHSFTRQGALREIAGRFSAFVRFTPLTPQAREEIAQRQIIRLGLEYGLHITHVAPPLVRELLAQVDAKDPLSVRSTVSIIEGCFTPFFLSCAGRFGSHPGILAGTLAKQKFFPADIGEES